MKILGFNIRKEYNLLYQEPEEGFISSGTWWYSDAVDRKEDLLPVIKHRKTQGFNNFKIRTRILIEFDRRMHNAKTNRE
jgi:hypothetical protein